MSQPVRQFFDSQVAAYSANFLGSPTGASYCFATRLQAARDLAIGSGGRLLDCACGTGEITQAVFEAGSFSEAVVADISTAMIEQTRRLLDGSTGASAIQWRIGDIFEILKEPARLGGTFDVILALGLIAHTGRLEELLRLLAGHLRPGGRILLQSTLIDHPGARLLSVTSRHRHRRQKGYDITWYSKHEIECAAETAGLAIDSVQRYGFCLPWGDRIWPKANHWLERRLSGLSRRWGAEVVFELAKPGGIRE
ncbi:MAG: class I SAM-dependent methyltransferase [Verrucomicrobiales bacterium]